MVCSIKCHSTYNRYCIPSLVPSPLPAAILQWPEKVVWRLWSTFLGPEVHSQQECVLTDQGEAILDFLKGRDVFVFLPTGAGKSLCFATLPSALLPFSSLEKHVRHTYWLLLSVSAIRSPIVHLARREPKGYSLFACKKKDLPRCRNTQHSVALPSCPYKFNTSLFPPLLRNQNWLPGPRKSTIVARPPFRAIAKWRPEVGWGRDYCIP